MDKFNDAQLINEFYALKDLDPYQYEKIAVSVLDYALSKTHGKDRAAIVGKVKKILKDYK